MWADGPKSPTSTDPPPVVADRLRPADVRKSLDIKGRIVDNTGRKDAKRFTESGGHRDV